ncbi:hypothetical protein [Sorangium sp. So ce117]|uniref:hypothetical protein n=1 Tax=Sorangium sp. So ce117 TaxID=3133277 RepID=UPI003F641A9B
MTSNDAPTPRGHHVLTGRLFRRGSSRYSSLSSRPEAQPVRRPAKVARMLALAHHLQGAIDRGLVADGAAVAWKLTLTRARLIQLLNLLFLAPDIQAWALELQAVDGAELMAERPTWAVAHAGTCEQRAAWSHALALVARKTTSFLT